MSNRTTLARLAEMTPEQVQYLPLDHLAMLLEDVATLKAQAKTADEKLAVELDRRFGPAAAAVRKAEGKDTGTVTLVIDNAWRIRADLPKKVEWVQELLDSAVATLRKWDEPISDYVKIETKVSEAKYAAWPRAIRDLFEPARCVSVGKPTYKIEPMKREAA